MIKNLVHTLRRILPIAFLALLFVSGFDPVGEGFAQSIRKDSFNHLTTGFPLTGAHERTKCENCHVQGMFKGTPKDCFQCHGPAPRVSSITMPQNHIPVSEPCAVCHNTSTFYGVRFNHASVIPGNCTQCHNGTTFATLKPARHIITTASCDSCHRIGAWLPATFNHNSVAPGSCAQCHNGFTATGKSATHLITSSSCDTCHTTTAWIPGIKFDHAGVIPGTCAQCHDGVHAPGQKPGHPVTNAACDACHSPTGWLPARVDHSTVVPGTCAVCHNGTIATGKKFNHIPTTDSCDKCHRPAGWLPTLFSHQGVAQGSCAQCHNGTNATGKPAKHLVTTSSCDSCHTTAAWLPVAFDHKGVVTGTCGNCHNGLTATGVVATHIPVTGNGCDSCHSKTNYISFAGTTMNHTVVPGVACTTCHETGTQFFSGTVVTRPPAKADPLHPLTGDCGSCHTTSSFGGSAGKPSNHLPTSQGCALCHTTPGTYTGGVMNHQGITNNCAQCHGPGITFLGVTPVSTPPTHIPSTGTACEGCHSVNNFTTFSGTNINHAAVPGIPCLNCHETGKTWFGVTTVTRPTTTTHPKTGDCGACHNTTSFSVVTSKPANHLPTSQPCSLCHTTPGVYTGGVMIHQGITNNCAQCHGPGQTFVGVTPVSTPPTHIPATGVACESCHSATNFTTFGSTLMNHAGTGGIACQTCHETGKTWYGISIVTRSTAATHPKTGDCGGACHNTTSFGGYAKPANHIPTILNCTTCHSNLQDFKTYVMSHQGIANNCSQCHGPGLVFATNFVPKAPPSNHIPTGAVACESCHSATNFSTFGATTMNHAGTGGLLCQSCHETGMTWFGITTVTRPTAAADPNHPKPGTGDCSACHSTNTFKNPTAKPANHIPTTLACATCHTNSTDYKVYTMSHQGIANNCAQCHGPGLVFATNFVPKAPPSTHIPSGSVACETCHSPTVFTVFSGTTMNHAGTGAIPCQTCHETGYTWYGITTVTRPTAAADPNHPKPGTGDCGTCHNTTSFKTVTTKPSNHLPTAQPCTLCHTTPGVYTGGVMNHQGITNNCAQCHGPGISFVGVTPVSTPPTHFPATGVACESCHSATNFTSFGSTPMNHAGTGAIACQTCHETGKTWYGLSTVTRPTPAADPAHPVTGDCGGSCHNTTSFSTFTKPANHIPTILSCATCHSNLQNFKTYVMSHQGIASNCAQCHGPGLVFATNFVPKAPPSNHIPSGTVACESCHAATNFTTFGATTMNHAGTGAIACLSCHETGMTWFGITTVTRPTAAADPNHPKTGDCVACHSTTTFKNATAKPTNHIPTALACATCHTNPADYKVYTMSHQGIANNCAQCHGPGLVFATNFVPKAPPSNHIPSGSVACESCHSPTNFTLFSGTLMNHAGTTAIACQSCHETGMTWFGITTVTRPTPAADPNHPKPGTGDCGACHTTTSFKTVTAKPLNHIPTNLGCTVCHSNPADYKVYTMNHQGITNGCATCHGPGLTFATNFVPKAPPATHIPTNAAACESCHSASNFTTFGGTVMTPTMHTVVAAITCATCHETGMTFFGVTIVTRPTKAQDAAHPPTGDCVACHTTTPPFKGDTKPSNHIPTTQTCSLCHTTPDYSKAVMNHLGITNNCALCHGPNLSFANIVPKAPPTNHVPYNGLACEACHAVTNFTTFGGTIMKHAGITATCISCHTDTTTANTTYYGVTIVTTGSPGPHVPLTYGVTACSTCHATPYDPPTGTFLNGITANSRAFHNFATVPTGGCLPCHQSPVTIKPTGPEKITTQTKSHQGGASCDGGKCHNTTTFSKALLASSVRSKDPLAAAKPPLATSPVAGEVNLGQAKPPLADSNVAASPSQAGQTKPLPAGAGLAANPHVGVMPGACATCHNGTRAQAKPVRHMMTALSCDSCHRTTAWIPASFRHAGVVPGQCSTCHNTAGAKAKPTKHVMTTISCDLCHRTTAWIPASYRHGDAVPGQCATCHNGVGVTGVPANHAKTQAACDACHRTNAWIPVLPNAALPAGSRTLPKPAAAK